MDPAKLPQGAAIEFHSGAFQLLDQTAVEQKLTAALDYVESKLPPSVEATNLSTAINDARYELQAFRREREIRDSLILELKECIRDVVCQYGDVRKGKLYSGSSALAGAFSMLGWDDPCPAPKHLLCDEPGCEEQATCGWPSGDRYRRTCGKCMMKYRKSL